MNANRPLYVAKWSGRIKPYLRVESFSVENAIEDVLARISQDDEGSLKIYKVNLISGDRKLVKRILILTELFLTEREEKAIVHQKF
ncbi:MAG: hypothetical protein BAJALOKI1v1_1030013 [Promethearchaeota archaeon]|nr:MAG: hypothetical protein BAJALOKI1v1_1030013 [Candidatus Lokiarchaeota archaeon]